MTLDKSGRVDIQEMFNNAQYEQIVDYANEIQQDLLLAWIGKDMKLLREVLRYQYTVLNFMENVIKETDGSMYAAMRFGALIGTMECLNRTLYEESQDSWSSALYSDVSVEHFLDVIRVLRDFGPLSEAELCKRVGLGADFCEGVIRDILDTGAVFSSGFGNFKIYSLTDSGLRYAKKIGN